MPQYTNPNIVGLQFLEALDDGISIKLTWARAYPNDINNNIAYHIYMSTEDPGAQPETFFNYTPSFISINGSLTATITDLDPGQMYSFAVRAIEYNPALFDYIDLPNSSQTNLKYYPESLLRADITDTSALIPLMDVANFPNTFNTVVRVGNELIAYSSLDLLNNNLVLTNVATQRGYNNTVAKSHDTDGYDGYVIWDPTVIVYPVFSEEDNTIVYTIQARFEYPHYAFTLIDGYKQETNDILNSDLSANDEIQSTFRPFDQIGWRRTDPTLLLNGTCVGSYIGGYYGCADGYSGVGMMLRGFNLNEIAAQREEQLLELTGQDVVLIKRQWTGIRCSCYNASTQYPNARCNLCFGVGQVMGYYQYFNPKQSNGRIRVRLSPYIDTVAAQESGLESQSVNLTAWALPAPSIHMRDLLVAFHPDGTRDFMYEVAGVERNSVLEGVNGLQKFSLLRIRKTDILNQIPIFADTSMFPTKVMLSSESVPGALPAHTHEIVLNEKITSIFQLNQMTSISSGHNHSIRQGVISNTLSHTHQLLIPLPLILP